jgi:hypothetical protein
MHSVGAGHIRIGVDALPLFLSHTCGVLSACNEFARAFLYGSWCVEEDDTVVEGWALERVQLRKHEIAECKKCLLIRATTNSLSVLSCEIDFAVY